MATATVSTEMNAPVAQVFALFTDIEHGAEHVTGIKDIKVLLPGPFRLGTRWLETREVLGRLDDAEMEVTSFEKNVHYTVTHHKAGIRIGTIFTFDPIGDRTKVSIEFDLKPHGLPPGLLSPLEWAIAGKVKHMLNDDLDDLKSSIERVLN
jgi:hypothetical protein